MVSWTFFCDIAGRVSKQYKSSWLSVNAVAIPSQSVSGVRSELLGCFEGKPPKWRDSASQDLKLVTSFTETKALPWVTVHVHRTEPAWGKFWESGKAFHDKLTQTTRKKAGFPKPATVIRYLLFSSAVALLIRICVREFGVGSIVDPHGLVPLSLRLVFDADIADPESRELFAEMYDQWQRTTRFRSELTIAPEVHVHFATEEEEPLLVLPDFLAGALRARFQASKGELSGLRANLVDVAKELELLPSRLSEEREESFSELYPLAFENGRVARS